LHVFQTEESDMSRTNHGTPAGGPVPVDPEPIPVDLEPVPVDPEPIGPVPVQSDRVAPARSDLEEPISLVDVGDPTESKVKTSRQGALDEDAYRFARPMNKTGTGATRCKLFHCRIALAPLDHLEHSINEWLDTDDIEIKQVGHLVGTLEGKSPEPNIFVMVWY
jgi:hypothetical protein